MAVRASWFWIVGCYFHGRKSLKFKKNLYCRSFGQLPAAQHIAPLSTMAIAMNRAVKRYGFLFKFQDETAMSRREEYMVLWHDRQISFFRRTKNFGKNYCIYIFCIFWIFFGALKLVVGSQLTWQSRGEPKICILSHKDSGKSNPTCPAATVRRRNISFRPTAWMATWISTKTVWFVKFLRFLDDAKCKIPPFGLQKTA